MPATRSVYPQQATIWVSFGMSEVKNGCSGYAYFTSGVPPILLQNYLAGAETQ